jgi:branched-chain amino acid transport system permease protein
MLAWLVFAWTQSFWIALALAPVAIALLSIPLYFLVLRRSIGRELMVSLLATSGLLFILDDLGLTFFGGSPRALPAPIHGTVEVIGLYYPVYRFVAMGIAALILVLFWVFLRSSKLGLWIRCVAQSHELAKTCGIPVERVYLLIVFLGSYFAAVAGVLAAPTTLVHYSMGVSVLGPAFIVIVVGGLGNLPGAVLASAVIGIGRGMLTVFIPPTYADVASIAILLPLLLIRPNGIFGEVA